MNLPAVGPVALTAGSTATLTVRYPDGWRDSQGRLSASTYVGRYVGGAWLAEFGGPFEVPGAAATGDPLPRVTCTLVVQLAGYPPRVQSFTRSVRDTGGGAWDFTVPDGPILTWQGPPAGGSGGSVPGAAGERGIPGLSFYQGAGMPVVAFGQVDDTYLDTTTSDLYQKGAAGWSKTGNLRGRPGTNGTDGGPGPKGDPGNLYPLPELPLQELYVPMAKETAGVQRWAWSPLRDAGLKLRQLADVSADPLNGFVLTWHTPSEKWLAMLPGPFVSSLALQDGHLIGQYSDGTAFDLGAVGGGGGGGLDLEAVQDTVAAMLGNVGTYDDAAGTYTITLPTPRSDEEIQDLVAALIQAGANVTKTYDDAGNVLTLAASGGSGGSTAPNTTPELVAIGDSITYGDQVGGPGNAWSALLSSARNWLLTNAGINGSSVSSGGSNPMVTRWSSVVPAGYTGHVTVMGGTNDYTGNRPLGAPGNTDPSSIYGALLVMAQGILGRSTQLTLHLLTPPWRGDFAEGTRSASGYTMEQVRQATRDVAAQVQREFPGQVQLIDLGRDLRDWLSNGTAYMGVDQLHPNAAGHQLIAQYLNARLTGASGVVTGYNVTFANLSAGNLNGQDGWTVYGGAATVSGSGLSLAAPFASQPRGVLRALLSGASRVRGRFALPSTEGVIVRAFHRLSDDLAVCAWSITGKLDWGLIQGSSVTSWIGNDGPSLPSDCTLEVQVISGNYELRYWNALSESRPAVAQYTHAVLSGHVPDAFGFSTTGPTAQTVYSISAQ